MLSRGLFLAVLATSLISSAVTVVLTKSADLIASGNPATDNLPRLIPYSGRVEFNGEPYSGELTVQFGVYRGAGSATPVFDEVITFTAFSGAFQVAFGQTNANFVNTVDDADDIYVGMTITAIGGVALETPIAMAGRQRLLPVPYALWAPEAADFTVNRDLTVARNVDVTGTTTFRSTTTSTGLATLNGGLVVNGATTLNGASTQTGNATITGTATVNGALAARTVSIGAGQTSGGITFANTGETRIDFPNNAFGGAEDGGSIVMRRDGSGEDMQMRFTIGNDPSDDFSFVQAGTERLAIREGAVSVFGDLTATTNVWGTCVEMAPACAAACDDGSYVAGFAFQDFSNDCGPGGAFGGTPRITLLCCQL